MASATSASLGTYVQANHGSGKIFVEDTGPKGRLTLICFPGIGDVRNSFRFIKTAFQEEHRVIMADLRGTGESQGFSSFTPEDVADDMRSIIEHFQLQTDVILVANSLSGGSAMLVAEGHKAVRGVVLLGAIVHDMPADKFFRPLSYVLFAWPWGAWLWSSYYASLYKRKSKPDGYQQHLAAIKSCVGRSGVVWSIGRFVRATKKNVEAKLHLVKTPTLAIYGDQDPDYPNVREEEKWIKSVLDGGTLSTAVLPQVGHYPHVEAAEETIELIRPFLAKLQ